MSRILALDYGKKRTGVAVTDPLKIIANGLITIPTPSVLDFVMKYVGEEKTFFIFLTDDAKPEQIDDLKSCINSTNNVKSLKYITKNQALEEFHKTFNNDLAMRALKRTNVL